MIGGAASRVVLLVGWSMLWLHPQASADQWVLGGNSATQWGDVVQIRAQIDDESVPGSIQIRGFTPDDNIISTLRWSYGKPNDLVSEGDAAIWDNTALSLIHISEPTRPY